MIVILQKDSERDYKSTEEPGLKLDYVTSIYDILLSLVSYNIFISFSYKYLSEALLIHVVSIVQW